MQHISYCAGADPMDQKSSQRVGVCQDHPLGVMLVGYLCGALLWAETGYQVCWSWDLLGGALVQANFSYCL